MDEIISIAKHGSIERQIKIVVPERYELVLVFERSGVQFEQLRQLLGDWAYNKDGTPIPSGVRIPVRWSLANAKDGTIIRTDELETFGSIGWSAVAAERFVAYIQVPTGTYLFNAKILRDVPEFANIHTRLKMQLPPKAATTWQVSFVWLGGLVNFFIGWPILIALTVNLIWCYLRYRSARSPA
ncbi:DUF5625 family protein [Ampullimonas aquatilis]|uniref:DUF5625 family protein n=1 Tax=Ampullimonas aquatilis TaxID=1341549 RepID=UPI003C75A326